MAEWFRSQDMEFVYIIINEDAAHDCIRDVGRLGCMQFTDLQEHLTPFQRRFVSGVKRCEELERKCRFFTAEIAKFGLKLASAGGAASFLDAPLGGTSPGAILSSLESELEEYEKQLLELNKFNDKLTTEYAEKIELHEVLVKSRFFFDALPSLTQGLSAPATSPLSSSSSGGSGGAGGRSNSSERPLLGDEFGLVDDRMADMRTGRGPAAGDRGDLRFSSMTGILADEDRARFERALFRATRGNCYVRFAPIEAPMPSSHGQDHGALVAKTVFIVFYKSAAIEAKARRLCDAFGARRFSVPDAGGAAGRCAVDAAVEANRQDLADARAVLVKNREVRHVLCRDLAQLAQGWLWQVLREKATLATLNALRPDINGMLRGEGWVVREALPHVRGAVELAHARVALSGACVVGTLPLPWPTPPTHFKLNAFTAPYQDFVDTYGVPRYKEANPALFTAVTFPFLFGIMYGDIGHGTCLTLGGAYLCASYTENPTRGEMMQSMYGARYMILMMGVFAIYAGVCYNDCFSLPLNLFTSQYAWASAAPAPDAEADFREGCSYGDASCVYGFGVDPAWHISANELLFFNSMKMKSSVILGILQMGFGILLKGLNCYYFKDKVGLWLEVLPMMVFAYGMFGYMIALIFIKWSIDWDHRMYQATCNADNGLWPACQAGGDEYSAGELCKHGADPLFLGGESNGCVPPNLITTLINIALAPGSVEEPMFDGQAALQTAILYLAMLAVPVLLFGRPAAIKYGQGKHGGHGDQSLAHEDAQGLADAYGESGGGHGGGGSSGHGEEEAHNFTEIVIHQCIETIEFVLGMVSNTASYLRLWALSLAHTELASVFWEKAMMVGIESKNPVVIFLAYGAFAGVTFAVLLCMDVLECFLHALRLHWVEFQNKFYKADGYKFKPFALEPILNAAL